MARYSVTQARNFVSFVEGLALRQGYHIESIGPTQFLDFRVGDALVRAYVAEAYTPRERMDFSGQGVDIKIPVYLGFQKVAEAREARRYSQFLSDQNFVSSYLLTEDQLRTADNYRVAFGSRMLMGFENDRLTTYSLQPVDVLARHDLGRGRAQRYGFLRKRLRKLTALDRLRSSDDFNVVYKHGVLGVACKDPSQLEIEGLETLVDVKGIIGTQLPLFGGDYSKDSAA